MTNDNKPPMFGTSSVINLATYEPRLGKTFWFASTDVSGLSDTAIQARIVLSNRTTTIPFNITKN